MRIKLGILSIILLGFTAKCNPGTSKRNEIANNDNHLKDIVIHFKNSKKNFQLSKLFSKIELIPLETNQKSLIGEISDIKITAQRIYILDKYSAKGLMVFDRKNGNFLFSIASTGKGPGEFDLPYDFALNPVTNEIYIKSTNKILSYTEEGKFTKEKSLNYYASNIKTDGHGLFVLVGSGEEPEIIVTGKSFNDTTTYFKKSFRTFLSPFRLQYIQDKGILYWRVFDNTMYKVTRSSINTFFKLHFPDARNIQSIMQKAIRSTGLRKNLTVDQILSTYGGVNVNGIFIGNRIVLMGLYFKKEPFLSVYNIYNGVSKILNYNSIVDDISGNISNLYIHSVSSNDEVIFSLQPIDINENSSQELQKLKNLINDNANPIIIIAKLKKL